MLPQRQHHVKEWRCTVQWSRSSTSVQEALSSTSVRAKILSFASLVPVLLHLTFRASTVGDKDLAVSSDQRSPMMTRIGFAKVSSNPALNAK